MYLFILLYLVFCSIISLKYRISKFWYYFIMIMMTVMMAIRYGQGTDYFGYAYIFDQYDSYREAILNFNNIHGEVGFRVLSIVFKNQFELFVFVSALYSMYCTHSFAMSYSSNPYFSLLLLYPTIYLVYYFSGIRQGLVIATFIGVGFRFLFDKKWDKYIILCLCLSLIHTSSLVWLIIPLALKADVDLLVKFGLPISFFVGLMSYIGLTNSLLSHIPFVGSTVSSFLERGFSPLSFIERVISLSIILYLFFSQKEDDDLSNTIVKGYLIGNLLFFALFPFVTLSGRIIVAFKVFELYLLPYYLSKSNKYRQLIYYYFILFAIIMYFHNVGAFIKQGNYYSDINLINYPFVSIFEKDEIWNYRAISYLYELID